MEELFLESKNLRILVDTDTQEVVIEQGRIRLSRVQSEDESPELDLQIENRMRIPGDLICRLAKRLCE